MSKTLDLKYYKIVSMIKLRKPNVTKQLYVKFITQAKEKTILEFWEHKFNILFTF